MDQTYVNNKSNRNSACKPLSYLSLSTTSLSSSSSASSSSYLRESKSFAFNSSNNTKYRNSKNYSRYVNSNSTENRRLSNSNQLASNISNNFNMNRKLNFGNKSSKNRQHFNEQNNNNNFNSFYGNSNFSNEVNLFENKKKSGQISSKLSTTNFENDETPQKKYKERKNNNNNQQHSFKDCNNQSNKRGLLGTGGLAHSGTASIGSTFNLNYKYQPPPFQPPAYHQNNKQMNHQNKQMQLQQQASVQKNKVLLEKYDRKYNLISFILLRKKDEYLIDSKFYLNDQTFYQKIDNFVEKRQLKSLKNLFLNENSPTITSSASTTSVNFHLANFTNSYNCNIFVYTIRKCLETLSHESIAFTNELIRFLFDKKIRPFSFYLTDGDYPKRNLMHYAARYNCELLPCLLLESFRENNIVETTNVENLEKTVNNFEEEEKLSHLIEDDSCIITESPSIKRQRAEQEKNALNIDNEILNFNNGHFVLAQLCMQTDFNDNTPIHLACQNNAYEFFKQVNPICIQHSQLLFNEDGLNPFLLASRHSSVKFLKHLIESIENSLGAVNNIGELKCLLIGVDKIYSKNCLHYACGRGCGKDALNVVKYLTNLAQRLDKEALQVDLNNNNIAETFMPNSKPIFYQLIGSVSPLVGSVYHVAASNLTRLTTLWYLLNLYPINGIYLDNLDKTSILNKLDFRDFTTVDCLIDSVMNLREMAPPNYKNLAQFYYELLKYRHTEEKFDFDILLRRCLFKLLIDFKVRIHNLPRIRNQLQLIEFLKLVVFMSKFDGFDKERKINFSSRFDSNDFTNFEGFCINFLNKFIFGDVDLMPLFSQYKENSNQENEKKTKNQKSRINSSSSSSLSLNSKKTIDKIIVGDELENLIEIFFQMYSLLDIVRFSNVYTLKFQIKLYSFLKNYSSILGSFLNKNDSAYQRFTEHKAKMEKLNPEILNFSLKNLCRIKINNCLIKRTNQHYHQQQQQYSQPNRLKLRFSALSKDYTFFKLPIAYSKLINFLTFDLVQDLYGTNFDLNKLTLSCK